MRFCYTYLGSQWGRGEVVKLNADKAKIVS